MTTKLDNSLRRELIVLGNPYTLVVTPKGLALTPKGRRKGYELAWVDLVSGDAALAVALNASLALTSSPEPVPHPKRKLTTTRSRKTQKKSSATRTVRRR